MIGGYLLLLSIFLPLQEHTIKDDNIQEFTVKSLNLSQIPHDALCVQDGKDKELGQRWCFNVGSKCEME